MTGGWAVPVALTADQTDMIRRELGSRRLAVFRDAERQAAFLTRIEGALTYLRTREGQTADPHRSRDRIEDAARALDAALEALGKLDQPERAAIEHGEAGQIEAVTADMRALAAKAAQAAEAVKMPRGAHDPAPGGAARMLVRQMAEAWLFIFERKPSAKDGGAFPAVVNIVLGETGHAPIGRDALRTILKGAGF